MIDEKNKPIAFANVYIKDSFDGTSTDEKGEFGFETFETGEQVIIVSFVGFEEFSQTINITEDIYLNEIILKQSAAQMNDVVITSGSFEASDENRSAILKPLDNTGASGSLFSFRPARALSSLIGRWRSCHRNSRKI